MKLPKWLSAVFVGGIIAVPSLAQPSTDYAYDALGRVVLVTYKNNTQIEYGYDSAGNRVRQVKGVWPVRSQNVLTGGQALLRTQHTTSPNGRYSFHVQSDGNLVLYGQSGPLWAGANSYGKISANLVMQYDGNLVLYGHDGTPLWNSGTQGNPGAWFVVQDDGNMVIYSATFAVLWASGTNCGLC